MGELIEFPRNAKQNASLSRKEFEASQGDPESLGKMLLFTGVRYERQKSLPSQRLIAPPKRV